MKNQHLNKNFSQGFTLLEILLVVAAIGILAGIVIFAINPSKQLADTRNAQRKVDVNTIMNAVYQYAIDNTGLLPDTITNTPAEICQLGAVDCNLMIDLAVLTSQSKYLTAIPRDPLRTASDNGSGYWISKNGDGRVVVSSPLAENDATISITR
jgi:prepilin-type N-terminal cleavage/methylation domain-containing protein